MEKYKVCPHCEEMRKFKELTRESSLELRGEIIKYNDTFDVCLTCDEEVDSENHPDVLRDIVYPIYRKKHFYVSPEKMIQFRKSINLTQKELGTLLGWGGATISRYENGALQDDAHDSAFQMAMNPHGLLVLLSKHSNVLSDEKNVFINEWIQKESATLMELAIRKGIAELRSVILEQVIKYDLKKVTHDHSVSLNVEEKTTIKKSTRNYSMARVHREKCKYVS